VCEISQIQTQYAAPYPEILLGSDPASRSPLSNLPMMCETEPPGWT